MNYPISKQLSAEFLGTFSLVFAGTGAIVIDQFAGGVIGHLGVSITFGLVVMCMICALGDISGAHFNPAVSVGFFVAGRMPGNLTAMFIAVQLAGAAAASLVLKLMFPDAGSLGGTAPAGPILQSLLLEIVLTFALMFVILSVSTGAKEKGITAGMAIGAWVLLAALFAGPVSGASMNPARSFGPALASGDFSVLWIYFTAPVIGTLLAVVGCRCVREADCCVRSDLSYEA